MSTFRRARAAAVGLIVISFVASLFALFVNDALASRGERTLSTSLAKTELADREAALDQSVEQVLAPQAVLADGRRGEVLKSLGRVAESSAMEAWASEPWTKTGRTAPRALLASLCRGQAWTSAVLTDRLGHVVAAWPVFASGGDLSKDPYFKALSDLGMPPGIVRHGYAPGFTVRGSFSRRAQLVAACGIADRSGAFGGLLKVRIDANRVLLGTGPSPLASLLSAYPGSSVAFVLGDGEEIYDSRRAALSENFGAAGFSGPLAAALLAPSGVQKVSARDGDFEVLWQRIGSAAQGAAPSDVLSVFAVVPSSLLSTPAAASLPGTQPFYKLLPVLLPLTLGLLALFVAVGILFKVTPPSSGSLKGGVSATPVPLPLPADKPALEKDRGGQQSNGDPAVLNALREELALAQSALKESHQDHEIELHDFERVRSLAEEQRIALEASKLEADRAAGEIKALGLRIRDLTRALETRAGNAENVDAPRKEQEAARLAAVNTLSEELKATLAVIKGYINTLLGGQGAIGDAQQEFLGVVINKSARLERLIGDLVEFSEIGSGLKVGRQETVAFSSLLQDALVNVRPQAENKNISLDLVEQGGAALCPVRADREKMGALLRALMSQAVKVTPRNEKIGVLLVDRDSGVELRITDSGSTLPSERAAKVFVQFHGVDSQAGPEFIGTGLRFAIARRVAEAHGGTITLENAAAGKGKTYVLTLPKASEEAVKIPATNSGTVSSKGIPGSLPALPKLSSLGPLPVLPLPSRSPTAPVIGPSGLPTALPPLPRPVPESPTAKSAVPLVHKPAPLDETFNAPWKRKETALGDDLDEMMNLDMVPQTNESKDKVPTSDTSDFTKVFGALPAPPSRILGAAPPAPPVPSGSPAGSAPQNPAPTSRSAPPPSAVGVDFDALFGPSTVPTAGTGSSASFKEGPAPDVSAGGMNTLDDLNKLLGQ